MNKNFVFEWDDVKNLANQEKHGIAFEVAAYFLVHKKAVIIPSNRGEEIRFMAIGDMENVIITVVFTRRNAILRIISARRASRDERKKYNEIHGALLGG